jgi:hypothetical protein
MFKEFLTPYLQTQKNTTPQTHAQTLSAIGEKTYEMSSVSNTLMG